MTLAGSTALDTLLERLVGLPLALAHAGAYLHERNIGIQDYLELYEKSWNIIAEERTDELEAYEHTLASTWKTSFDAAQKDNGDAAELLLLWSCLDNKDLGFGLLQIMVSTQARRCFLRRTIARQASRNSRR
jgi:hypothetical protein